MSNPNYTAILFILDSSGSMDGVYHRFQEGMHLMLEQQARKLAGYLTVDVGYFEDYPTQGVQDADPMTVNLDMYANGGTQLYDSMATLLTTFEDRLSALPANEQPGHVVVVVMTDGQSSYHRTTNGGALPQQVSRLINTHNWDFAFLGAFKGALETVMPGTGIPKDAGIEVELNNKGVQKLAVELGEFISMTRAGQKAHF